MLTTATPSRSSAEDIPMPNLPLFLLGGPIVFTLAAILA